jgi:rubrerythrin
MRKKLIALRVKLADMSLADLILGENVSDLRDEDRYHECRECGRSFEDKPRKQCPNCEGEVVTYILD